MSDRKISIRKSKNAIIGLEAMVKYIRENSTKELSDMNLIEIGSYAGDSTEVFAKYFGLIYAVDPWQNGYDDTDAASYQIPMFEVEKEFDRIVGVKTNVEKIRATSLEALKFFFEKSIDVVYIDGIHTYDSVCSDIKNYWPLLKLNGWLCGHDYQGKFPGVMQAVNEFRKPNKVFLDSSWAIKKDR